MINESLDCTKLYPKVHLYQGLIDDPEGLVKTLRNAEKNPSDSFIFADWKPWSVFGSYVYQLNFADPDFSEVDQEMYEKEKRYLDNINEAFYKATNDYLESYGQTVKDDWYKMGPSFCKYDFAKTDEDVERDLAMRPHTDYVYLEADTPGNKFTLTCTMYLNDTYEGGEIEFIINEDTFKYKPKAGDIMVFPSGHPDLFPEDPVYFHSVKQVLNDEKYFVRCFYQTPFEGSDLWHQGVAKYGKEKWEELEKERLQSGIPLSKVDYV